MAEVLPLSLDELLTTTRTVRKRLDLSRPVERDVIIECLEIAQQAPSASNMQNFHFVIVTDPEKKAALAELYRRGWEIYIGLPIAASNLAFDDPAHQAAQMRVSDSINYLAEHIQEVPVLVIPCLEGRTEDQPTPSRSALWGSVGPAVWNFMLAARSRGLGTAWTSFHLFFEEEAAKILGIPYNEITQACLIPLAYTIGTEFKPGWRKPLDEIVHWDSW